jgi:membrane protein YdbS with pleckstrin-like domain
MGYPEDVLGSGEAVLMHMRTHWKVLFGAIIWLVLGIAAFVLLLVLLPDGGAQNVVRWVGGLAILVGVGWFAFVPLMRWLSSSYTITTQRILSRQGVVRQTGRNIPLRRVSGVSFEKGLVDRAFGCGTLMIESSAEAVTVVFHDVPDVANVQRVLTDLVTDGPDDA